MKVLKPADFGRGVALLGTGSCLPARVVTNDDLVALGAPLTAAETVTVTVRNTAKSDPSSQAGSSRTAQSSATTRGTRLSRVDITYLPPSRIGHPGRFVNDPERKGGWFYLKRL